MRIYKTALFAILMATGTGARAADWWLIDIGGNAPKRVVLLMDKASLNTSGIGTVKAWLYSYFENALDGVRTEKTLYEFDCSHQTYKTISYINYSGSNDVVGSNTIPTYSQTIEPVAPGTMGEAEMNFACGTKPGYSDIGEVADFAKGGAAVLRAMDTPAKGGKQ